ncbi:uncharacterized protein DNG_09841 [Cephalotrichum gorgonifer]|uniref:RING-type domain-containing protein n=1 Tax=Cephalotrichum gorgonifer TaxID=2041049 RepID=A0AAE8N6L9_9PEZI|nr:uncharacterized protein DNG_09841 [Cephalotrichum gorgonifer]
MTNLDACKVCEERLFMSVVDDEGAEQLVPDNLLLPCDCHFHWECLVSQADQIVSSLQCPSCGASLAPSSGSSSSSAAAQPPILTTYVSEGGVEENLDILPVLTEESYLSAHPEARPARALHVLAEGGDVHSAVELLHSLSDDGEEESLPALVRYQDPLAGLKSALHIAVKADQEGMVWLLLWLSSNLPEGVFPDESRALAEAIGLGRLPVTSADEDIRSLRDANSDTAEALARSAGTLSQLLQAGILTPPS